MIKRIGGFVRPSGVLGRLGVVVGGLGLVGVLVAVGSVQQEGGGKGAPVGRKMKETGAHEKLKEEEVGNGDARDAVGEGKVIVSYVEGHPASVFVPSKALGAGLDGHEKGEALRMLSPANVREMKSAGLKPLTYRLRTELAAEVWHWNPRGRWSDAVHQRGYWVSDSTSSKPINLSYGYRLPRRGSTTDQANDDGYSRLDDGDTRSFWKSNPYLDQHFTGEANAVHPQWAEVDLVEERDINALQILWGTPFATKYEVQYSGDISEGEFVPRQNAWHTFEHGTVSDGKGGNALLKVCDGAPVKARFVRVLMLQSSHMAAAGSKDIRDALGYAIRELSVGTLGADGRLQDEIRHSATHDDQSIMYVSSTDPWHRAIDKDPRIEQPGLDFVFRSGLTSGQPLLTPVGVLYDTPENAAAEVAYLARKGFPVERIEMGEEPDGQFGEPEDYAALYMQWAKALHVVNPKIQLGGPGFENLDPDDPDDPNLLMHPQWTRRFLAVLKSHNRLGDYNFFSFEWYPFDDVCVAVPPKLLSHAEKLSRGIDGIREVLPSGTPLLITELGYSAFGGEVEVGIEGAILNADAVGVFLTRGGEKAYVYGYEPNELIKENSCDSWGNNMLFGLGQDGRVEYRTATYYGARMMTELWAQPADQQMEIYPAHSTLKSEDGSELVTAYAVRTQAGKWSLMLLNKDPAQSHTVKIQFEGNGGNVFEGPIDVYRFSSTQYVWHSAKDAGRPEKSEEPEHKVVRGSVELPAYSITVVRR